MRARVIERWVFNFRVDPDVAAALLPVPWLAPVVVDGSAVFSFCPYVLRNLRIGPFPTPGRPVFFAAGRITAIDVRVASPTLAWVPARQSGNGLADPIGRHLLKLPFERVTPSLRAVGPSGEARALTIVRDGATQFSATLVPGSNNAADRQGLFPSVESFETFFHCETSLSPAPRHGELTRLDLHASGTVWRPVGVRDLEVRAVPESAAFDSAYVGTGGSYRWSFESGPACERTRPDGVDGPAAAERRHRVLYDDPQ